MDGSHFDTLVKTLATTPLTRANALRRLAVSAAALAALGLGLATPDDATAAKSGKCKRKPGPCETCKKGKCARKRGKKSCKAGKIKPKAIGTLCAGGSCDGSGNCLSPTGVVIPPPPQRSPSSPSSPCPSGLQRCPAGSLFVNQCHVCCSSAECPSDRVCASDAGEPAHCVCKAGLECLGACIPFSCGAQACADQCNPAAPTCCAPLTCQPDSPVTFACQP